MLAAALLHACPQLSILATSREVLGVAGEAPFRVPQLSLPNPHQLPAPVWLTHYEAIRLFIERAQTVSPSFQITQQNATDVAQICQRLDGIPLAIELAAARVHLLQVAEIAQRLDDRFRLLTGGSRAVLPRQQTLRASIDWSYDLLSPFERLLLQRLTVFTGGWTLGAAEAVGSFSASGLSAPSFATEKAGSGEGDQTFNVLELLGQLVDKSLIQTSQSADGLSRFRMLETIHQYAHEKLVEAGQAQQARDHHLQYYLELAEQMEWQLRGPDQIRILNQLEAELDNLRLG
jgi:predicted ATPase